MILADTNVWIEWLNGDLQEKSLTLDHAMESGQLLMSPFVLFEILSHPGLEKEVKKLLCEIPQTQFQSNYWVSAAKMRASLLDKKLKVMSVDCFIAQNCIDHHCRLLTYDLDFRHFKKFGLELP